MQEKLGDGVLNNDHGMDHGASLEILNVAL